MLAVEQVRDLSKTVPAEISKLQEQAVAQFKTLPDFKSVQSQIKTIPATVQSQVKTVPATVSSFPATVKTQLETVQTKGQELYVDLINRGEKLVSTIRRQPATQVTVADVKNVETTVKATAESVKPAAKSAAKVADKATTPKA